MKILKIDSGLFVEQSVSRQLTDKVVAQLSRTNSDAEVITRDVVAEPISHLDANILMAGGVEEAERTELQKQELAMSETLLEEIFAADVLVIGAPMYNFTVPSQLKAWIDRIAQAGKTFRYTENGAEGLLKGKKAIIASARGGIYSEGAAAALEHQESYLTGVLNFIGITDVSIVRAEGVAISEDAKQAAIGNAEEDIKALSAA
ncbi:FMN-dependent NADH-azoreductase [Aliidiomarina sp. B3213]|nr:NAD(P)H-dependent oxidoreductase [Aliidiomarina sp. B3213]RTE85786.1 FMN-dependent NADH-azoreductase [Aliidiomarina sp. B3213]TCZ90337.1 FMN-dependent NADH-azoreductase [Lysobacter sp. N42]